MPRNVISKEDLDYLINWYDIIGPEEMALAIDRTEGYVIDKVWRLRKKGIMKPSKANKSSRCLSREKKATKTTAK